MREIDGIYDSHRSVDVHSMSSPLPLPLSFARLHFLVFSHPHLQTPALDLQIPRLRSTMKADQSDLLSDNASGSDGSVWRSETEKIFWADVLRFTKEQATKN